MMASLEYFAKAQSVIAKRGLSRNYIYCKESHQYIIPIFVEVVVL